MRFTVSMRIDALLHDARQRLNDVSSSPSLDAQVLLAEILDVNRAYLLTYPEREPTPAESARYEAWITRRAGGEPVAYILGCKPFYDREMIVTPAVLIPRPETELLLEWALELAKGYEAPVVVDVGTGSGALAVTFAALVPQATVYAIDLSPDALAVARRNAEAQQVKVTFLEGDLLTPLIEQNIKADLVLANLPYIASAEVPTLAVSQHEPVMALDGGVDGLDLIRQLLDQTAAACNPGANILLEIGADQGAAMRELGQRFTVYELRQDYAGLDRMVQLVLP